jgi:cation:H+ antiporter
MNPLLLVVAGLINRKLAIIFKTKTAYTIFTVVVTALLATGFYLIDDRHYPIWVLIVLAISSVLFWKRPEETTSDHVDGDETLHKIWLIPALGVLIFAGYFLDDVVTFTSEHSHAPKALVGFVILSMLTSWPEFKSCMALLKRQRILDAILNITVSNITNLWLAIMGVIVWLFF